MIKFSKSIITKFIVFAAAGLLFTKVFFLAWDKKSDSKTDLKASVMKLGATIQDVWTKGPSEDDLVVLVSKCSDIPMEFKDLNSEVFRCNPSVLYCQFRNEKAQVNLNGFKFEFLNSSFLIDQKGDVRFSFKETKSEKIFSFGLKRDCHVTRIPEKVFSATEKPKSIELWDSYRQNLKVDQFYISQYEYELIHNKNLKMNAESDLPILRLDLNEMKKFCQLKGGQLLKNHIFEAISFYPAKVNNGFMFKSHVPWAKTINLQSEQSSSKFCHYLISKECKIKKYSAYMKVSPGWIPVYHLLGGEFEVFDNTFEENKNLKVSSRFFSINNKGQKNSFRIYWNGQQGEKFKVSDNEIQKVIDNHISKGVAFRCMY